jgi:hypothetical protein
MILIDCLNQMASMASAIESLSDTYFEGQMIKVLQEVGTRHMEAAILQLQDSERSPNYYSAKARVDGAINSLQEAYVHLSPSYQNAIVRFFREANRITGSSQKRAYGETFMCTILIAICYKRTGESKKNIKIWLNRGDQALEKWCELHDALNRIISPGGMSLGTPSYIIKEMEDAKTKFGEIRKDLLQ